MIFKREREKIFEVKTEEVLFINYFPSFYKNAIEQYKNLVQCY